MFYGKSAGEPVNDAKYSIFPLLFTLGLFTSTTSSRVQHAGSKRFSESGSRLPPLQQAQGSEHSGIRSKTGEVVWLFHPRNDQGSLHFEWRGPVLRGRTPIGCATIPVLSINDPDFRAVRQQLVQEQVFRLSKGAMAGMSAKSKGKALRCRRPGELYCFTRS